MSLAGTQLHPLFFLRVYIPLNPRLNSKFTILNPERSPSAPTIKVNFSHSYLSSQSIFTRSPSAPTFEVVFPRYYLKGQSILAGLYSFSVRIRAFVLLNTLTCPRLPFAASEGHINRPQSEARSHSIPAPPARLSHHRTD